jgi:hypothetical protein
MSPGRGPVRLIVKSRRVPVALTEIEFPQRTSYGVVSTIKKRSIVYDYVLDEGERRIVAEVRQAAENSGLPLEVVDVGKAGTLSRIVRRLLMRPIKRPGLLPSGDQMHRVSVCLAEGGARGAADVNPERAESSNGTTKHC